MLTIEVSGKTIKIKISGLAKDLCDFTDIKHKRKCWKKCHTCNTDWNMMEESEKVHLISYQDPKQFENGNGTFFICNKCKTKI